MNDQLTAPNAFAITSLETAKEMAGWIAASGCFGIKKPEQALTLMMISQSEGQTLAQSLKRYHFFDDGKLSQRADYTKKEFEKNGTIIWHVRSDEMVAASFFAKRPIEDADRERAIKRFEVQWKYEDAQTLPERDGKKESALLMELSKLSREGEITIIRTLVDADAKGISQGSKGTKTNWATNPRAMLQWRCLTEGVNAVGGGDSDGLSSDVDLADAINVEQKTLVERASAPQSNDLDAMQAILRQHEENALAALQKGDEREAKRQQGLASDMRITIQEAQEKMKPANLVTSDRWQQIADKQVEQMNKVSNERPTTPSKEAQDEVPMIHATDRKTADEKPEGALEKEKAKVVEAKVDHVEPPAKASKTPSKQEEASPFGDEKPAGRSNDLPVSELSAWREYKLQLTPGPFKGRLLGSCTSIEINVLYKKRSVPFLHAPDEALRLEALMIQQAHDGGPAK